MRITYEICHSGTSGQKWGVRRYRNYDGKLTTAGKNRYYEKNRRSMNSPLKLYGDYEAYKEYEESKKKLEKESADLGASFVSETGKALHKVVKKIAAKGAELAVSAGKKWFDKNFGPNKKEKNTDEWRRVHRWKELLFGKD